MTDAGARRPADVWASGDAYEPYVGRWSRIVAREFIAWLAIPPGSRWLDVGCGTGAISQSILDTAQPASIVAVDPSEAYAAYARRRFDGAWVEVKIGDARALPVADGAFDAVVCGLMLNFVPAANQPKAAAEMVRAARLGGTVGAYVWDYAGEMQFMRHFWDAAVALDPENEDLDEGPRFPICQPEPLAALYREAGLSNVAVRAIDIPTVFRDFDDYWTPFLGGQGAAPAYAMALTEEHRTALRDRIRAGLPFAPDGSIHLIARVWAARGTVAE